jgi:hypothetical protein
VNGCRSASKADDRHLRCLVRACQQLLGCRRHQVDIQSAQRLDQALVRLGQALAEPSTPRPAASPAKLLHIDVPLRVVRRAVTAAADDGRLARLTALVQRSAAVSCRRLFCALHFVQDGMPRRG